jgi:redox-sensitive bicupin YhaK (pirin superfamily)
VSTSPVEQVIAPPLRDLGEGFTVRRALPGVQRRMVGPFIFCDELGPVTLAGDHALDVRPHPHIGLATVTHLIAGAIDHRDSLGSVQTIRPGAVNWMTAGRGIVHSERSPAAARGTGEALHAIQLWVALPVDREEMDPAFDHYPADILPVVDGPAMRLTVLAGRCDGLVSPVVTQSELVLAECVLNAGGQYVFAADQVERAIYVVSGAVQIAGHDAPCDAGQLVVLRPGMPATLTATGDARLMLLGGQPFPERRLVFWNFVSSRPDRIEQAKADWRAGRFDPVPGETEWIPLPDDVPGVRLV